METKTVPVSAIQFAADVELGSNGEGAKTAPVKIKARSGKPIQHWFWGRVVHDLGGMRSKSRIPIDYCHDDESVIGYANNFDSSSGDLVVSGALVPYSADPEDKATEVIYKASAGIPYEGSIFFDPDAMVVEDVGAGMQTQVNGVTFDGPLTVIRQWTLRGVAICPYGKDGNTEVEFNAGGKSATVSVIRTGVAMSAVVESTEATTAEAEKTKQVEASEETNQAEVETPTVEAEADKTEDASLSEGQRFLAAFGDRGGVWFAEGKTFDEAQAMFAAEIRSENDRLKAENETLRSKLSARRGEPSPVSFEASDDAAGEKAKAVDSFAPKVGGNLAKFAAGIRIVRPGQKKQ